MPSPKTNSQRVVEFRPDLDRIYKKLYIDARTAAFTAPPNDPIALREFFDLAAPLLRGLPNGLVLGMPALIEREIALLGDIKNNPPINVRTPEGEPVTSIQKLAAAIEVSPSYLYDFRRKSAVPCIKIMARIAWAFGLDWLAWNFPETVTSID